jgi:DNA-binding LacI/PurR family transcriptional regulator
VSTVSPAITGPEMVRRETRRKKVLQAEAAALS